LFFYASGEGGTDYAKLHIAQEQSPYSISGTMTPAVPHLLVLAYPIDDEDEEYMVMSNAQGSYQLFLPAAGYYNVRSFDPTGLSGLTTDDSYDNLFVDDQLGDIDFTFFEGTSAIYGYLTDDNGSPLADVEIYAYNDNGGGSINGITDDSGYYRLSVSAGEWYLEADEDDLIPAYLVADGEEVTVAEEDSVMHN
ncbi:MAG: carboxypeptidase regulatory-like domain-containing protein, partial [Deltaproteobacteria bacterium]|nr:carboxypeptidase regulatory-like domain-containing protein [Deltaproteobacteria bacterium]